MKKILVIILFVIVISVSFLYLMIYIENNRYEEEGYSLVKQIETYREKENKLPDNLNSLGIEEPIDEGPYYEIIDSINYKVYFFIGFDNSKVYYSKTKKWKDEP
ncbi:MAG: hypothetical protein SO179_07340 [Bacteroidales bacterium]|nr:hypothetical protein [Bacteroidales bacterium]